MGDDARSLAWFICPSQHLGCSTQSVRYLCLRFIYSASWQFPRAGSFWGLQATAHPAVAISKFALIFEPGIPLLHFFSGSANSLAGPVGLGIHSDGKWKSGILSGRASCEVLGAAWRCWWSSQSAISWPRGGAAGMSFVQDAQAGLGQGQQGWRLPHCSSPSSRAQGQRPAAGVQGLGMGRFVVGRCRGRERETLFK